jgi:uncharacterized protein
VPVAHLAVYAATKAYVTSFSEALRAELRNVNISVTALCPGPVPTEFSDVANRGSQLNTTSPAQELFSVPVQEVVRRALNGVSRDKARVIPGILVNLAMTTVVFVPMYLKRLILNAQAAREKTPSSSVHPDFEISGMI